MRKRHGAVGAAALLVLLALPACDPADGDPSATPTASAPATSSVPTPSASPTPTAASRKAQVKAAQEQYVKFYTAYIDFQRTKPTGTPPASLLAMTDPDGSAKSWVTKAFAEGKRENVRVGGGDVKVTTGPERGRSKRANVVAFQACHDQRDLVVKAHGKRVDQSWLLGSVEMRASGTSADERTRTGAWKVLSMNQISAGESCDE